LADLGDDPEPIVDNFLALQQMKGSVTVGAQKIASVAAELAGEARTPAAVPPTE
jgi:hypothetical protein